MILKNFPELQQSVEWGLYVTAWKNGLQRSAEAKAHGFDSDLVIEGAIAAFVNAAVEERITRFAFAQDAPHLVTCNGKDWHFLQLPAWRRGN